MKFLPSTCLYFTQQLSSHKHHLVQDSLVVGEVRACDCEVESELCLDVVPSVLSVAVADVVVELDVVGGISTLNASNSSPNYNEK